MNRLLVIVLLAAFVSGVIGCRSQAPQREATPGDGRGDVSSAATTKAPDFSLPDLWGNLVSLKDYQGKGVILDFWATWCAPCVKEIPNFIELHEANKDKGLVVIGIALDDNREDVTKFVAGHRVTYPVLHADTATLRQVTEQFGGIQGIPTTFLVRPDRGIAHRLVGYHDKETFEELLPDILPREKGAMK